MPHELLNISSCLLEISLLLLHQHYELPLFLCIRMHVSEALVDVTTMTSDKVLELGGVEVRLLVGVHGFEEEEGLGAEEEGVVLLELLGD